MIWLLFGCGPPGALGWFVVVESRVVDEEGEPVAVAEVQLVGEDGGVISTVYTAPDGSWSSPIYGRELKDNLLKMVVTADGFAEGLAWMDVTLVSPEIHSLRAGVGDTFNTVSRSLPAIRLAAEGDRGGASGSVIDARTGLPVSNLDLQLLRGAHAPLDSEVLDQATTDAHGHFEMRADIPGNYTVVFEGDDHWQASQFPAMLTTAGRRMTGAVSPFLRPGELRATVLWPDGNADLDLHVVAPSADGEGHYHVWSGNSQYPGKVPQEDAEVFLELSDDDGEGPETLLVQQRPAPGDLRLTVFDYTGYQDPEDRGLGQSNAVLQLWYEDISTFFEVDPQAVGSWWHPVAVGVSSEDLYRVEQYAGGIEPSDDAKF